MAAPCRPSCRARGDGEGLKTGRSGSPLSRDDCPRDVSTAHVMIGCISGPVAAPSQRSPQESPQGRVGHVARLARGAAARARASQRGDAAAARAPRPHLHERAPLTARQGLGKRRSAVPRACGRRLVAGSCVCRETSRRGLVRGSSARVTTHLSIYQASLIRGSGIRGSRRQARRRRAISTRSCARASPQASLASTCCSPARCAGRSPPPRSASTAWRVRHGASSRWRPNGEWLGFGFGFGLA